MEKITTALNNKALHDPLT